MSKSIQEGCHVDVVVEALVREHLSKKKYTATLEAFKSEQPALQQSINKRSVLQRLLGLEAAAQAEAQSQGRVSSSSTLELWVQQQLKHTAAANAPSEALSKAGNNSNPMLTMQLSPATKANSSINASPGFLCTPAAAVVPSDSYQGKASDNTAADRCPRVPGSSVALPATTGSSASTTKAMSGGAAFTGSVPQPGGTAAAALPAACMQQQQQQGGQQHGQRQGQPLAGFGPPRALPAFAEAAASLSTGPCSGQDVAARGAAKARLSSTQTFPEHMAATANSAAALASHFATKVSLQQQPQNELVIEDVDVDECSVDETSSSGSTAAHQPGQPAATPSRLFGSSASSTNGSTSVKPGTSTLAGLQPLLPDQQRQLSKLLWGDEAAKPDASWQQGLVLSDTPGLEWGLVQLAGGPCGVLAAVQAHLVATLMEQGLWGVVVNPGQLLEALVTSLATMLWTARSSSTAHVVVLPQASSSAAARGLCDATQAARVAQVATAESMQQLQVLIKTAMPQWCQRKGWGMLLLLYSLLLTRSCLVIQTDMDMAGSALVDNLGYCSMELVNLMLTGVACSNVFDGRKQLGTESNCSSSCNQVAVSAAAAAEDSHTLMGVASRSRVGLLTLFEWYSYVEVGENLKSPQYPVWVVCSESHFTVLALAAVHSDISSSKNSHSLALGMSSSIQPKQDAAVVLEFYDGMARQEGSIQLVLLPAKDGKGWTSKMAGVTEDRGTWCGRPIPPLECVCETKWKDVQIVWRGSDPIL